MESISISASSSAMSIRSCQVSPIPRIPPLQSTSGSHDRVSVHPLCSHSPAVPHKFILIKESVFQASRAVMGRLGAEFAVFAALAAPAVYYTAKIHTVSAERLPDPVRTFCHLFQITGDQLRKLRVRGSKAPSIYDFSCQSDESHADVSLLQCVKPLSESFDC